MSSTKGFQTLDEETILRDIPVRGTLPDWLEGTLVRNGPAKFEVGGRNLNHWFDGFAMLHAFRIREGRVDYRNRYLRSDAFEEARQQGQLTRREFATDPCRSIFKRVMQTFAGGDGTDNASVNITRVAGEHVAMTESPMDVTFDPETLKTTGHFPYEDDLELDTSTAHPHFDFRRGELVNQGLSFGRRSRYHFYAQPADSRERREIATLQTDEPGYAHSFAMSEHYLVLTEIPWVVNPLKLLVYDKPFAAHFEWKPELGTRFRIFDRDSGELVKTVQGPPLFTFHHVNAFEVGGSGASGENGGGAGELVVDLSAYPDSSIVDKLYLNRLREHSHGDLGARLRRFRLPLSGSGSNGGTGEAVEEPMPEAPLDLPRINYRRVNTRPYRRVWGVGQTRADAFIDQLVGVDVDSGGVETWQEEHCWPGEPVFVPRPEEAGGGQREDDGLLLSVVLDGDTERSFLLVLDAETLDEMARAQLPHHVPFGFHGMFMNGGE